MAIDFLELNLIAGGESPNLGAETKLVLCKNCVYP